MKEKSIIFFDIDGTLLNEKKELPASTKQAINELKEKGHIVAIATGRAPFMYTELREELAIDTFVSYNGQYVYLNNELIYTNPLNIPSLVKLAETSLSKDHAILFMDEKNMKANVPDHRYIEESIRSLQIEQYPTHDPYYYNGRELYQSILFCAKGEERYYEEQFTDFDFIRWHPLAVDILPKDGSKANGIKKVIEKLGIYEDNIYAFGDGLNDIEMLQLVKNSVAMGNGEDVVKEAAKYVTTSVEDDGIINGLKMVGLL